MSTLITSGLKSSINRSVAGTNPLLAQGNVQNNYVKVLKVVLNESDVDASLWAALGFSQALYGVFYQGLYEEGTEDRNYTVGNFAYCADANFHRLPLPGEVVLIEPRIRVDRSQNENILQESTYWTEIVPTWNSPNSNFFIASGSNEKVTEPNYVTNPLQLNPGDTALEGRYGQSIRLGGGYRQGSLSTREDVENPYIIIRNGQGVKAEESDNPVYENINRDNSSIYLTTNQTVKLTEANSKLKSWKTNTPSPNSDYTGSQVILNSDRIIANAKANDIKLLAKQNIALSGQRVGIDGSDFVSVDADKIYLGKNSQPESEPVLRGKTTTEWLSLLCTLLDMFLGCFCDTDREELATVASVATVLRTELRTLSSTGRLEQLHSDKIFVE